MIGLRQLLVILICFFLTKIVSAIKCYHCDNSNSAACGQEFKAYQFNPEDCHEQNGIKAKCGKQQQPPDKSGWIGVIRSCYYSGDLPGINETVGCHHYFHDTNNFTALYCFCDTAYCNVAPTISFTLNITAIWMLLITISALVCPIL